MRGPLLEERCVVAVVCCCCFIFVRSKTSLHFFWHFFVLLALKPFQ